MRGESRSLGALAALAVVSVWLFSADAAHASHYVYLVDDPAWNPNGMQSDYGKVWGGNKGWITAGKAFGICNDWNVYDYNAIPQGARDAISAWESVLGNTQFSSGCGLTGYGLNLKRSTVSPGYPCSAVVHGCIITEPYQEYDPARKAWYPTTTDIWFNTQHPFNDTGYKAVAAHELGHVFGLDEAYVEANYGCNSAKNSVMDVAWGTGYCDTPLPNSYDTGNVASYFWLMPIAGNIVSQGSVPGAIYISFNDLSFVESSYYMAAYFCCNSSGQPVLKHAWYHTASVGKRGVVNGVPYYRGSNPVGLYQLCGYTYNTVSYYMHWSCSNWYWVP